VTPGTGTLLTLDQLSKSGLPVEKTLSCKIRQNEIASGCVISDLLGSQDIFYPQILTAWDEKRTFQQPQAIAQSLRFLFANELGFIAMGFFDSSENRDQFPGVAR
jgi:hypothetical protein